MNAEFERMFATQPEAGYAQPRQGPGRPTFSATTTFPHSRAQQHTASYVACSGTGLCAKAESRPMVEDLFVQSMKLVLFDQAKPSTHSDCLKSIVDVERAISIFNVLAHGTRAESEQMRDSVDGQPT